MSTSPLFKKALKKAPYLGGIDFLRHTTVEDLHYLTQHEIDLYEEGEQSDIKTDRELRIYQKYLNYLKESPFSIGKQLLAGLDK